MSTTAPSHLGGGPRDGIGGARTAFMEPKMDQTNDEKNGQAEQEDHEPPGVLSVARGGMYGTVRCDDRGRRQSMRKTSHEIALDDRMQQRYVALVDAHGVAPSRPIQEICEGRGRPWRSNARRALELISGQVDTEEIRAVIIDEMADWLDDMLAQRPRKPAA